VAQTLIHDVPGRFLPKHWRHLTWTDFEDATLIEVGTVFYDPQVAYAGIVTAFITRNDYEYVAIQWFKADDNYIRETYTRARLTRMELYWADPVMQEV